jgi:hypothetical protein
MRGRLRATNNNTFAGFLPNVATLPTGHRPGRTVELMAYASPNSTQTGVVNATINQLGSMSFTVQPTVAFISFDGVTFPTD